MSKISVSSCTELDLTPYLSEAKRADLVFSDSTQYFLLRVGTVVAGFCGMVFYRDKVKFKNDYVLPSYRGQGLWTVMFDHRRDLARSEGKRYIEATCTPMSLPMYLNRGATIVRRYKKHTAVRIDL